MEERKILQDNIRSMYNQYTCIPCTITLHVHVPTLNHILCIVDCLYFFPSNRAVTVVTATGNEPWQRIQGNTGTEVRVDTSIQTMITCIVQYLIPLINH